MSSTDAIIRSATPADVGQVFEMIRELAVFEKLEDQLSATPESLHEALFGDTAGSTPMAEAMVAEVQSGQLVGYAIFFENFSTFLCKRGLYLEDIYVRPDHRRCGIGKLFLKQLASQAIARGCGRMEWCVLDWNQNAIDVYESIGGNILQEWRIVRLDENAIENLAG